MRAPSRLSDTASAIPCMNRIAESTTPIWIATVRSTSTVSAKANASTSRSPIGAVVMMWRILCRPLMFHATTTSTAASAASGT